MINFNFTVNDSDAENIMYLFHHKINTNNNLIMKELCKNENRDKSYIEQLKNDIVYWTELKTKLTNTYID